MWRLHACDGDIDVDGRILIKYFLKNWDWEVWTGFIWLSVGTVCRAIVNAVMNLQVLKCGSFSTS
jgi:hypothetical protein